MPRTRRDGSQCFKHMSDTTSENDDGMLSKDQADLSSFEEGNSGGTGSGTALKKGPWTSAEDAILIDYVKKHGEGNWNAVQKYSGLSRCGKSCRLRWANHLRPNLKKGSFTAEEEHLIIELHAKLGNKWARMAAHLPGRTDNEIKNFWNTRVKRRQRAGLLLYSPDTCLNALSCQQNQNMGEMNGGNTRQHGLLQAYYPDVIFENDKANPGALSYAPLLPNVSVSSILNQGLGSSQSFSFMPTTMHCDKRPQESEASIKISSFNPFQNDSFEKIHQPFGLGLPYDPDLDPDFDPDSKNSAPFSGVMTCSHAYRNGNFSASMPLARTVKQELPSLQHSETNLSSWGTCSPSSPSLEAVDAYVQSPCSPTVQMQSESLSGQNSGLLQSIFHDSQTIRNAKTHSFENGSNSTVIMPTDRMDNSTLNVSEEERNGYGDPISPLGYSAASVFNESTPPISSCSLDESPPSKVQLGSKIKAEPVEYASTPGRGDKMVQLDFSRPDTLLGADFFDHSHEYVKDLATFVGDDFFSDYKNLISATNSATHGLGLGANGIT